MQAYRGDVCEAAPPQQPGDGYYHGFWDAGILFFGDSMIRPLARKMSSIRGNYTMVGAFGGKKLRDVLQELRFYFNERSAFRIEDVVFPRKMVVICVGTNDLNQAAVLYRWSTANPGQWMGFVDEMFELLKSWIGQHRTASERFLIVGILDRHDIPTEVAAKIPADEFLQVRSAAIRRYNHLVTHWTKEPGNKGKVTFLDFSGVFAVTDFEVHGGRVGVHLQHRHPNGLEGAELRHRCPRWRFKTKLVRKVETLLA